MHLTNFTVPESTSIAVCYYSNVVIVQAEQLSVGPRGSCLSVPRANIQASKQALSFLDAHIFGGKYYQALFSIPAAPAGPLFHSPRHKKASSEVDR
jgi:hypothetical protein